MPLPFLRSRKTVTVRAYFYISLCIVMTKFLNSLSGKEYREHRTLTLLTHLLNCFCCANNCFWTSEKPILLP